MWDCKSQSSKPIQIFDEAKDSVSSLDVSGHEIAAGSVDGRVRLYDLRMGMMYVDVIGRMSSTLHNSPLAMAPFQGHGLASTSSKLEIPPLTYCLEPVTSVQQTRDSNALLVSTLDSTIRLLDKGNGQLLQSYTGHQNKDYRVRATLAFGDSLVISGSEDGSVYAWDLLEGTVVEKLPTHAGNVISSVAANKGSGSRREWASSGGDGEFVPDLSLILPHRIVPYCTVSKTILRQRPFCMLILRCCSKVSLSRT